MYNHHSKQYQGEFNDKPIWKYFNRKRESFRSHKGQFDSQ